MIIVCGKCQVFIIIPSTGELQAKCQVCFIIQTTGELYSVKLLVVDANRGDRYTLFSYSLLLTVKA